MIAINGLTDYAVNTKPVYTLLKSLSFYTDFNLRNLGQLRLAIPTRKCATVYGQGHC